MSEETPPRPQRRMAVTAAIAAAAAVGMVGMAYAAVPLYRLFCQVTGYGGTTQTATSAPNRILAQTVEVRFDTNIAPGLPLEFSAEQRTQTVRLGETSLAFFNVRNTSDRPLPVIARFNVAPHLTGRFFQKLQCFCFSERILAPGESASLPVLYFVDPDMADDPDARDVRQITLSYTYFPAEQGGS